MIWRGLLVVWALWPQAGYAASSDFDYYLLALSVAPAFCEDNPGRTRRFAQCRQLNEAAFKAMPLTLHGLWPNRLDRRHPAFCAGETRGGFCRLPAISLPADTRVRLGRVMPATADCLDRYQWAKHGSCSGLREADYFAASATLTERVNRALGAEIARHMGREVSLDTLRAALARNDPALKEAVTFDCQMPATPDPAKRRPMLREVRVGFARNPATGAPGAPLDYRRIGHRSYNSGCPGGRAYVDSPLD
ncbi:MAG: ribonuclease I [Thiobacillus sp.]|nr:ribonuclease I [Thiobacillus sp.]